MTVTVTLNRSELDYDVGMLTHVIMNRELAAGATLEQGWNYANTSDHSGEVHLISRFEENAINELVAAFARYLPDSITASDNNLSIAEVESFEFPFIVPDNFMLSYVRPLRSAMHEFVVNRTLFDWFIRTKPDEAGLYKELYEDALSKAKGYLNKRTGFIKIKPFPAI